MQRIKKIIIGILVSLLCAGTVSGQKAERDRIREGNKLYNNDQFTEAEIAYRKSIEVNPRSFEGAYDLGNALYKQQKFPEAAEQYQLVAAQSARLIAENPDNINRLAQVFHNLGNITMNSGDYAKSIEAYKQSLRLNPADNETRYNLALAQKLLENSDQEQDQDQQQDEQEQQQDQPQQDENQQQEPPPPDENLSRENAEQILDTFLQDEREVQERVREEQQRQQERRRTDREW